MSTIPTAEEFLLASESYFNKDNSPGNLNSHLLIAFAKMHVEAALKAASEQASCSRSYSGWSDGSSFEVNKDSILDSYSLTNIK
jgi:hypothetical protein